MNKKAQGLSLNTIIIAALVIMVLIILGMVFMGRMGTFASTSKSCSSKGGTCIEGTSGFDCPEEYTISPTGGDCPEDQICCAKSIV